MRLGVWDCRTALFRAKQFSSGGTEVSLTDLWKSEPGVEPEQPELGARSHSSKCLEVPSRFCLMLSGEIPSNRTSTRRRHEIRDFSQPDPPPSPTTQCPKFQAQNWVFKGNKGKTLQFEGGTPIWIRTTHLFQHSTLSGVVSQGDNDCDSVTSLQVRFIPAEAWICFGVRTHRGTDRWTCCALGTCST